MYRVYVSCLCIVFMYRVYVSCLCHLFRKAEAEYSVNSNKELVRAGIAVFSICRFHSVLGNVNVYTRDCGMKMINLKSEIPCIRQ